MATGRSRALRLKKIRNLSKEKSDDQNWPVEGKVIHPPGIKCGKQTSNDGTIEYFKAFLQDVSGQIPMIAYGDNSEKFESEFTRNRIIRIKKAELKGVDRNYIKQVKHRYEIVLKRHTQWEPANTKGKSRSAVSKSSVKNAATPRAGKYRPAVSQSSAKNAATPKTGKSTSAVSKSSVKKAATPRAGKSRSADSKISVKNAANPRAGKSRSAGSQSSAKNAATPKAAPNTSRHKFQKSFDDNLCEANMQQLTQMMKSVGAVLGPNLEIKGTCFCIEKMRESLGTFICFEKTQVMTAFHVIKDLNPPVRIFLTNHSEVYDAEILYFEEPFDFAVLEISGKKSEEMPSPLPLLSDERIIAKVVLIGFGNPTTPNSKQFEPPCHVITKTSELIRSLKEYANSMANKFNMPLSGGYDGIESEHTILLNCWQQHGASGAPLIGISDSGILGVVGILTHGVPNFYWDLPEDVKSKFPGDIRFEVGTKMSYIMKWLDCQKYHQAFP